MEWTNVNLYSVEPELLFSWSTLPSHSFILTIWMICNGYYNVGSRNCKINDESSNARSFVDLLHFLSLSSSIIPEFFGYLAFFPSIWDDHPRSLPTIPGFLTSWFYTLCLICKIIGQSLTRVLFWIVHRLCLFFINTNSPLTFRIFFGNFYEMKDSLSEEDHD